MAAAEEDGLASKFTDRGAAKTGVAIKGDLLLLLLLKLLLGELKEVRMRPPPPTRLPALDRKEKPHATGIAISYQLAQASKISETVHRHMILLWC